MELAESVVVIREFDASNDSKRVENLERSCEVGHGGKISLFTDLHGDPTCRVRHAPASLMLVAEIGDEIVGLIRGCIKTVTCGRKLSRNLKTRKAVPVFTKAAYILGLRVSPSYRRMRIGYKLVQRMEEWFRNNGVEYSYIATEKNNQASVKLFTDKCGYSEFRTPSILVNPVYAHRIPISSRVCVVKIPASDAEVIYRQRFSTTEFFPRDIDAILANNLSLGTFVAFPKSYGGWPGAEQFLSCPPDSWAVMSVWNCKDVFTLEVRGASLVKRTFARTTRALDRTFPFLRLPSVPEVFRPFGFHFIYGLGGDGPRVLDMVKALCAQAHNLAKDRGCAVVATEVSSHEPLRFGIPHWKVLSCPEDLWCIKRLGEDYSDGLVGDWTKSPAGQSIFVDPREF